MAQGECVRCAPPSERGVVLTRRRGSQGPELQTQPVFPQFCIRKCDRQTNREHGCGHLLPRFLKMSGSSQSREAEPWWSLWPAISTWHFVEQKRELWKGTLWSPASPGVRTSLVRSVSDGQARLLCFCSVRTRFVMWEVRNAP